MTVAEASAAGREIVALHVFFDGWLSGRLEAGEAVFTELREALSPDFTMVGPTGKRLDQAAVLGWLATSRGSRGPDFRIWIENVGFLLRRGSVQLASYDECQHSAGTDTRRRVTVVFEQKDGARNGLVWLAVHETWVEAG
ncbi:MAG: hypothetical protein NT037_15525 [Hyphomicrobiales bacterium]|jgi:hypothetical protein|nr:hypothetical protein [Hyphomicrobiales bacterium]